MQSWETLRQTSRWGSDSSEENKDTSMETAYRDVQTHLTGEGGTSVKPQIGRLNPPKWPHVQAQRWVKVQNCTSCQSAKAGSRTATARPSADLRDSRKSTLCSTSIKAKHSDPGWWTAARWRKMSEERLKEPGGPRSTGLWWPSTMNPICLEEQNTPMFLPLWTSPTWWRRLFWLNVATFFFG